MLTFVSFSISGSSFAACIWLLLVACFLDLVHNVMKLYSRWTMRNHAVRHLRIVEEMVKKRTFEFSLNVFTELSEFGSWKYLSLKESEPAASCDGDHTIWNKCAFKVIRDFVKKTEREICFWKIAGMEFILFSLQKLG